MIKRDLHFKNLVVRLGVKDADRKLLILRSFIIVCSIEVVRQRILIRWI
jgi:hypothetical protein